MLVNTMLVQQQLCCSRNIVCKIDCAFCFFDIESRNSWGVGKISDKKYEKEIKVYKHNLLYMDGYIALVKYIFAQ